MLAKKTLELNPNHPVMQTMLNELKENDGSLSEASTEYANLLFQMAILNSGFLVENPMDLTEPLEKLIRVGFGIERDAEIEEIEVELDDEEEEEEEEADGTIDEDVIDLNALDDEEEEVKMEEGQGEEQQEIIDELWEKSLCLVNQYYFLGAI